MKKTILTSLLMLSAVFILTACGKGDQTKSSSNQSVASTETTKVEKNTTASKKEELTVKKRVDNLIQTMTLEEKVGQLFMARVPEQNQVADIQNYHLGGYLLFDRDMEGKGQAEVKQAITSYQEASKTPMFIGSDEEGGTVSRLSRNQIVSPPFQSPQALNQTRY